MAKNFRIIYTRCYQWLCICRKNIIKFKIIYAIEYRGDCDDGVKSCCGTTINMIFSFIYYLEL